MKTAQNLIKEMVEKEATIFLKRSKVSVQEILNKSVLSLMGIEKRGYDKYEIDHCNGRNSVLIDAFRSLAAEEAKKIAKDYKPTREDLVNFKAAFEREFKSAMGYALRDAAKERALELAKKFTSEVELTAQDFLKFDQP